MVGVACSMAAFGCAASVRASESTPGERPGRSFEVYDERGIFAADGAAIERVPRRGARHAPRTGASTAARVAVSGEGAFHAARHRGALLDAAVPARDVGKLVERDTLPLVARGPGERPRCPQSSSRPRGTRAPRGACSAPPTGGGFPSCSARCRRAPPPWPPCGSGEPGRTSAPPRPSATSATG